LHPNVFSPSLSVLEKYGLRGKRFIIIRRVEFNALHDSMKIAATGITDSVIDQLIAMFNMSHRIILNYEGVDNPKYTEYILKIDPSDMLDLIYYADLLIGDSQSMQVEAALLGTPSIRSNKWVQYREKVSVTKAKELLSPEVKSKWREKMGIFYEENVSLTDLLYWLLGDYRLRIRMLDENPDILTDFIYAGRFHEERDS
jgi:hypothetical protein